jgi:hypothetical protein
MTGDDASTHGPIPSSRVPRTDYTESFLYGLQQRNQVVSVSDSWDHDTSKFPTSVRWVMYPNGDLERVGMAS